MPPLKPWSPVKTETYDKLQSLWMERCAIEDGRGEFAGGLQWKTVKNQDYLIHYFNDPTSGKRVFKSKGPRNAETEAFFARFMETRSQHRQAAESLDEQLRIQSAAAKAMKVGRAPVVVGEIFRAVAESPIADQITLAGSMAMVAYEIQARSSVPSEALAVSDQPNDLDLFVRDDLTLEAFEELLRSVDRSFRRQGYGGHRFGNGALTVDCFTTSDLSRIAFDAYGEDVECEETVLNAMKTPGASVYIVDRSGQIATARAIPIEQFCILKSIRSMRDEFRNEADRSFDARQAEAAKSLIRTIFPTGEMFSRVEDQILQIEEGNLLTL